MKIISITGTKGKTTVTRVLSHLLFSLGETVLRVDTDGHSINERRKSTLEDSRHLFRKAPTVCPGKYLITMKKYYPNFAAVLETAVGSNGPHGLGYSQHQIGIFTNVYEDHLGISRNLQTQHDLACAKSFIYKRIDDGGYIIFNADDWFVCSVLNTIPAYRKPHLLPAGVTFKYFDIKKHLRKGGAALVTQGHYLHLKKGSSSAKILDIRTVPWTFSGSFLPSVYNLMFILGGVYAYYDGRIPRQTIKHLQGFVFPESGGRLTLFEGRGGIKILVDYAHEKQSLLQVANLAHSLGKRTLGVVRLAPDRTNAMILDTGRTIANAFDDILIYDKIDGKLVKSYAGKNTRIRRKAGEVSQLFLKGIKETKTAGRAERYLPEAEALKRASTLVLPGDCVVVICGDDHARTVRLVKKLFQAHRIG